jgi:Zn-finger nucleic acid-binding protein
VAQKVAFLLLSKCSLKLPARAGKELPLVKENIMNDAFDERRKALEEGYFHRKEQEALERLRAKMAADTADAQRPRCPKCDGHLVDENYEGITIERCTKCAGVWLDKGELRQLTHREDDEGGFFHRLFS